MVAFTDLIFPYPDMDVMKFVVLCHLNRMNVIILLCFVGTTMKKEDGVEISLVLF